MDIEKETGVLLYATQGAGTGGRIRQQAEDFLVEEITNRTDMAGGTGVDSGKYLLVELTKKNWDTHHLVRELSRIMHISQDRFGWAGTKDRRALTRQLISIWNVSQEDVCRIRLRDVELAPVGRASRKLSLGDLWGNRFMIVVRDIALSGEEVSRRVERINSEFAAMGGAPNFFGIQRFGEVRPITHIVGEAIVRGDTRQAVLLYVGKAFGTEPEETQKARNYVMETGDFRGGIRQFPHALGFERAVMDHLVSGPDDYAGALRVLSPNLQRMFVHAYQSYIFNHILSRRLLSGLPLGRAVEGDLVCFRNEAGLPDASRLQKVTGENLSGINNLAQRGRVFVTAPLVGYGTALASGQPGEIERAVIEELGVDTSGFRVKELPELSSEGKRREIVMPFSPAFEVRDDEFNPGKYKLTLEFTLQKGGYATSVLREYIKSGEPSQGSSGHGSLS
ncbi:MAG TPA: tRNA pseudouridine(13) synthase TruD [Candidatus Methanoperedenaceae archaeon]|nr:tRNA pseudouridine(13) synthase TruD [Candidatus Methanoperedenaceae archaeon]